MRVLCVCMCVGVVCVIVCARVPKCPLAGNPGAMFPSTVYLVDPIEAGEGRDALLGSLKPMLEGPAIKIMHDCSRVSFQFLVQWCVCVRAWKCV